MDSQDRQQSEMWGRVVPGTYVEAGGRRGRVVSVDHDARAVTISFGEGPAERLAWDDVDVVILGEVAEAAAAGPGDLGAPDGETLVHFSSPPTRKVAMVSLQKVMGGPDRLKDATGEFLRSHLLAEGDRLVQAGIVYEVTFVNLGKARFTLTPVGITVDAEVATRKGLFGPSELEQRLTAEEERRARFGAMDVLVVDCECFGWDSPWRDPFGHAKGCTRYQGTQEAGGVN